MIFVIAIFNFYGLLNVIKSTFVNEAEGNKVNVNQKYSLVSLIMVSVWDGYFCMIHFFFAVNTDVLIKIINNKGALFELHRAVVRVLFHLLAVRDAADRHHLEGPLLPGLSAEPGPDSVATRQVLLQVL